MTIHPDVARFQKITDLLRPGETFSVSLNIKFREPNSDLRVGEVKSHQVSMDDEGGLEPTLTPYEEVCTGCGSPKCLGDCYKSNAVPQSLEEEYPETCDREADLLDLEDVASLNVDDNEDTMTDQLGDGSYFVEPVDDEDEDDLTLTEDERMGQAGMSDEEIATANHIESLYTEIGKARVTISSLVADLEKLDAKVAIDAFCNRQADRLESKDMPHNWKGNSAFNRLINDSWKAKYAGYISEMELNFLRGGRSQDLGEPSNEYLDAENEYSQPITEFDREYLEYLADEEAIEKLR